MLMAAGNSVAFAGIFGAIAFAIQQAQQDKKSIRTGEFFATPKEDPFVSRWQNIKQDN